MAMGLRVVRARSNGISAADFQHARQNGRASVCACKARYAWTELGAFWARSRHYSNMGTSRALVRKLGISVGSRLGPHVLHPTERRAGKVEMSSPMTARLVWSNPSFPFAERPRAKPAWRSVLAVVSPLKQGRQTGNGDAPMSSSRILTIDGRGHTPACPQYKKAAPGADEKYSHADLFCGCHSWSEPKILPNGTNIAWPAGWTQSQATAWRVKCGLAAPAAAG